MNHSLEIDSIILEFDSKRVLQDIYLLIETGKATGILGRNGTGKTCLMKIIFGEIKTNNKSIRLDGKTIMVGYRNPGILRYLPQFNFIPKNLKVKRVFKDFNLDFSRFKLYFPEFEKYYNSKLKMMSSGEIRIIEIYSILASESKFCMLDEPFSQVMPVHVETIKSIIKDEKKRKGIVITDQLYDHVMKICDEIYLLTNGKTYLTKNKSDLIKHNYINETINKKLSK